MWLTLQLILQQFIFYLYSAGFTVLEIQKAQEIFQNVFFFNGTHQYALFLPEFALEYCLKFCDLIQLSTQ
jgi:hypothetical protein